MTTESRCLGKLQSSTRCYCGAWLLDDDWRDVSVIHFLSHDILIALYTPGVCNTYVRWRSDLQQTVRRVKDTHLAVKYWRIVIAITIIIVVIVLVTVRVPGGEGPPSECVFRRDDPSGGRTRAHLLPPDESLIYGDCYPFRVRDFREILTPSPSRTRALI
jgi:hypothetical protein